MKPDTRNDLAPRLSHLLFAIIALGLALAVPSPAAAKDKLIMSMVSDGDASGSDLFVGCESSGLVKMIGPKIQIQLKKLAGKPTGDGTTCTDDDVICIVQSSVHMNTVTDLFVSNTILRGDLKKGNLKIKVDTCKTNPALCAAPNLDVRTTDTKVTCYESDPGFVSPAFSAGTLSSCEGVQLGEITPPTSPVIAEIGMMGTCD